MKLQDHECHTVTIEPILNIWNKKYFCGENFYSQMKGFFGMK